ncbi:glycosyltransferase [Pseudomonas sp. S5D5]|uniref:glycosyltransferase n=1 Tax=Pseudomonas sp. S5D5 TaxID=2083056 RepID=UPI000D0EB514|nr:glycosyltransferase [Pseudomonas sp. S5D5]
MLVLSIITVVFNDRLGFVKTANSVFEQRQFYPGIEYIVIDGGSTDGTVEAIEQLSDGIDYWVSERDSGIYDAMNKGWRAANGNALLFLNAGDYFVGDVLSSLQVAPAFLPVKYVDIFGRFRNRPVVNQRSGISNCHQGIVFEAKSIAYDCTYDICADYKYFLEHGYSNKISMLPSKGHVFFDAVGVSATRVRERDRQIFDIRCQYFGTLVASVYELKPWLKRVVRSILGKIK